MNMAYTVYLRGGPEPVGVRTDNRIVIVTEPVTEVRVPVEGGGVGLFRYAHEEINMGSGVATVFDFAEVVDSPS